MSALTSPAPPRPQPPPAPADPLARARISDRDVLVLALFVLVAALVMQVTPARDGVTALGWRLPETCAFKVITGRPCPGCGLTRSFILAIHGDPEAFHLHPLGPLLLVTLLVQIPYRAVRLRRLAALRREGLVEIHSVGWKRVWLTFRYSLIAALLAVWLIGL